ncbi:hypothetical protein [Priestia aryabhattai]|nr:hypothetical protein [Priestia aryabhattai]
MLQIKPGGDLLPPLSQRGYIPLYRIDSPRGHGLTALPTPYA